MDNNSNSSVRCPVPPELQYSVLTSFTGGDGVATATYVCVPGYVFDDDTRNRSYECQGNLWSTSFVDCERKFCLVNCMRTSVCSIWYSKVQRKLKKNTS